ncbi:MAG: helicase-related protein, partial [Phenylobacterium sp.]|uniref:helicase-related protein n=1 Tax=Phenylobacterium sp. TaxID=1871053 RepID=UPI00391A698E
MSDRPTGQAPSRLVAVLGPTNTGKTHLAVERMLGHASGMIGLPLRLLAREIYDRIVKLRGPRAVALITGEEKIVPPRAVYFVCTVEAMPLSREVEFLAVDEIQLCADPERGHVFTHRLLHARGKYETMFMGAATMAPLVRALLPKAEIVARERFSALTYQGSKKLTRLPRRTAVVAFSADQVYGIAELIRRQRGGAAVVMGSLSPRTRNAQVELYQSGEVDFLVATDAIGMGLNMDVDHVAFAGLRKFDGRRTRWLHPPEIGQIAGRAGRFRRDGTFGVTGEADDMDPDLVAAVEGHRFEPLGAGEWRNAKLDFSSLANLMASLSRPPDRAGLKLAAESLDETTLRQLAADPDVAHRCRDRVALMRLWDVCQTPDFRKTSNEEHLRLAREFFGWLTSRERKIPQDWMAGQFRHLDRTDGEIDTLSARLAGVRTLAYVANRPDWLADAAGWQGRTRALEDRLSDTLHEKLMARFVDRRTSALMRALRVREDVLAGVGGDGEVTVEGHYVGRLSGVRFEPAQGASLLEEKALRAAANAAVAPEIARRLGALAAEGDEAFALAPDGLVLWRGEAAGALAGGAPFAPRVRLLGELGPAAARERAARRLEAFIAAEAGRRLSPLRRLESAVAEGAVKGLARGLAYRLIEGGGVLDRAAVREETRALSQVERRTLKGLGVRIGAFSLFMPGLLKPEALAFAQAFTHGFATAAGAGGWRPPADRPSRLPDPAPAPAALAAFGLRRVAGLAVPVSALERLDELLRGAPRQGAAAVFSDQAREELGWSEAEARAILKGLGFAPQGKAQPGEPQAWRRRGEPAEDKRAGRKAERVAEASPFAALAALKAPPPRPQHRPACSATASFQVSADCRRTTGRRWRRPW